MRRLILLLLLAVLLPAAAASQRRRPPAPKKVPEVTTAVKAPQLLGVSIEKYISEYAVNSDGTAIQTVEMYQKCSAEACIEQMKKLEQVYNAELQTVRLVFAAVIKKDGTRVDVSKDNGQSLPTPQAEAAPDFSSLKQLEIVFKDYELGDTISHKLEVKTTKPIFGNHFDSLELYPAVFEWKAIEVNVSAPDEYQLHFDTTGLEGGELPSVDGRRNWRWKRAGVAAIPVETAMLDTQRLSPRFAVTTFASYEQLGAAFGQGLRSKAVITPEVQSLADEITKGIRDPSEQAAAIYQWVNKNIRYLLVVLDRGGWIPHSTEQILKNRYGDCKDYTALIYAMLKAKGIESVPVLINAKFGNWFPTVATMEHFDHAILYIPDLKLYADATSANTRLGMIPQQLVGKTALQAGDRPGLITVPRDRPDDNQLISDVDIEILENGTLRSTSSNTFAGRSEILFRPLFSNAKSTGIADMLVKLQLAYYGLTGTGQVLEISDPHAVSDPFKMKLEAEIPDFTTIAQKGSISIPSGINALSISTMELYTKEERRNTDLFIGATRIRERFKVRLPLKVTLSETPAPIKFGNAVGTFELSVSKWASGFELNRELVLLKDSIEPSEYAAFKELVTKAVSSLNTEVPYSSDGSLIAKRPRPVSRATTPTSGTRGVQDLFLQIYGLDDTKLTPAEVRRLEAKLKSQPSDLETREKLLSHYRRYDLKETVSVVNARRDHKVWFIRNRPERAGSRLLGWFMSDVSSEEYIALRDEWKKQIATKPANIGVWLNATELVKYNDHDLAEEFLAEGKRLHPNAYEFPRELSLLYADRLDDEGVGVTNKLEWTKRCVENGKAALQLLKKERSDSRDSDRAELLIELAPITLKSGDVDLSESLARELVLDFGGDTTDSRFETAAHIGNTLLGRSALVKGEISKAVEHLLISIRAPLRKPNGYFYEIDLSLAAELFRRGEKKAVTEFLETALKISGYVEDPETNEDEIAAIKKWISEIAKGSQPTFDFERP